MRRFIKIIIILLIFLSCNQNKRLEGLWYGAYVIKNNKIHELYELILLEFKGTQLYTIKIRDSGELDKFSVDTTRFEILNSKLKFDTYQPKIQYSKDSLLLNFEELNQKLVLKRVDPNLRNPEIHAECFLGSFFIMSKNYTDSIHIINDSLLIYTGEYNQNFPGKKWQIVDYNGYKFLNIHELFQPVTIIKSCNTKGIELILPSNPDINIKFIPVRGNIRKEHLIGIWNEIENSNPKPPVPPNLSDMDLYHSIEFQSDSIKIKIYNQTKRFKWDLTTDGKRIYFFENVLKNEGSWKLLELSDSSLTIRISSRSGLIEEIVKFKRENFKTNLKSG